MDILEFIKKMQEMYGEDVITTANKIKRPDPKPIVKEIEAINEFVRRNPRAQGGRIGFKDGTPDTSPVKTDVYKYPRSNRFGTVYSRTPGINQY